MKRYFVTSVVPGAEIDKSFAASIQTFCKEKDAELLLIPTRYVYKTDVMDEEIVESSSFVDKERFLNAKIKISDILIDPKVKDPVLGMQRQSRKDGSLIVGSPKQRLKLVPNGSNVKMPHALMSPGAITKPYYPDTKQGRMAYDDHVIGGIIVEIENGGMYHFRQVQSDNNGSFIDLGIEYSRAGSKKIQTEALIPGDYHAGDHDLLVKKVILELSKTLKPKSLVLHDLFNGKSVNRHEIEKKVSRAGLGPFSSLEYELMITYDELVDLSKDSNKVYIIRSNHDMWIDLYLEEGRYIEDSENFIIGHKLAIAKFNGEIPLEAGLRALDTKNKLKNVEFLTLGSDLRITPKKIQLGAHGHQGANGARGNTIVMERTYGNSVSGHSHTPEILHGAYVVGTSTHLVLPYNEGGASSWLQTLGIVYYNGARQLITVINGKYKA